MIKRWKNLSLRDKTARFFSGALLAGVAGAIAISISSHSPTLEYAPVAPYTIEASSVDPAIERMLDKGECWVGEGPKDKWGNPIMPTRVIYAGEVRGSKMVDKTLKAIFNDAANGIDPKLVSAYCK